MNAAEFLLANGADAHTAIECGDRAISYRDLRAAVQRAAGAWRAMGLATGDRVLINAPDGIDWAVAYLGVLWAGGVAVGLNNRLFERELSVVLAESGARFIWCDAGSAPMLERLLAALPEKPDVVPAGHDWDARVSAARPLPAVQFEEDSPALWIYTSGTTGVPKAVIHAQRTVLASDSFARGVLGLSAADRLYATSKLFFAYAIGNSLFAGLRLGATVILDGEWPSAERVAECVANHRPTVLFSVPTLYRKMLTNGVIAGIAKCGVRQYVSAGEAMPALLHQALTEATGRAPISGYGTSETLLLMFWRSEAGGSTQLSPGVAVRAAARGDAAMSDGAPQRIGIRHSSVALGYWRRPAQELDSFDNGWFSPGDLFRDAGGNWEFCGRTDDMLKISGQWVSTLAVEQALAKSCGESVQEMAAVGFPNHEGLTSIALFAIAVEGRAAEAKLSLDQGIAALPGFQRPRLIRWVGELPHTATGKLQRNKLAEQCRNEAAGA
jgi:acyl-coenzyme A synthetase/AMP-(fatty) acid ligase